MAPKPLGRPSPWDAQASVMPVTLALSSPPHLSQELKQTGARDGQKGVGMRVFLMIFVLSLPILAGVLSVATAEDPTVATSVQVAEHD